MQPVRLPQSYISTGKSVLNQQLHIFNDASELAHVPVAYFRNTYTEKTVDLKFIIGKARESPLKKMTIPNLELQAATNGIKIARFTKGQHEIKADFTTL